MACIPQSTRDETAPPPVPLRRRFWFAWTLLRLGCGFFATIILILLSLGLAIAGFRHGSFIPGCVALVFALLFGALVFVRLVILRHNIRRGVWHELRRRNCCPHCGYDLRASHVRCPECGAALREISIEI